MLKKIRCFYWKMRDRGKGRQVKLLALVLCIAFVSVVGLIGKSIVASQNIKKKVPVNEGTSTGATVGALTTTEGAVSGNSTHELGVSEQVPLETPIALEVDTSGLDSFLGFMSDAAYSDLENQIVAECQMRQCSRAKKLNYQITSEGSFDVTSFILMADGSVYQCEYNLKSEKVIVKQTTYSEADIQTMSDQEQKAEQEALEKQQKEDKKNAQAKKKSKKSKSKKNAKKKKSTKRK